MNTYLDGSVVRVMTYSGSVLAPQGGFRDASGNLADPTTVTLKYRAGPTGTVTTVVYPAAPIVKDAVGLYHADLDTTGTTTATGKPVIWSYYWDGTGAVQAPAQAQFEVSPLYLP